MPKLKAIHLSRVGHPSARLDGISIYFTAKGNPYGKPEGSTIIALRNGGGKTSLLQLLFSTFIPDKREFSGRTSEGGERSFDQYFQPNDLGMIVTEWDLGKNLPNRVIGQCVVKNSVSDTNPDQCFFSFLVTDHESDFKVSNLPLRQFKSDDNLGNASSFYMFKQLLRSNFTMRPHQELVLTETQKEWLTKLRSWGYEPDLFRLLIALNKSEGGSKEMAKNHFGNNEKMIGLIAMLSTSEQDRKKGKGAGNIYDLISQYREDLSHIPEMEIAKDLWDKLSGALADLIVPGQELVERQKEKSELASKLAAIGRKILATPAVLAKKVEKYNDRISRHKKDIEAKQGDILSYDKTRNWVEREIRRLIFAKSQETFDKAQGASCSSGLRYRALEAHNVKVLIKDLQNKQLSLIAAIKEATEPTRDIEDTLHAIGHRLNALLEEELNRNEDQKKVACDRLDGFENKIKDLRKEDKHANILFGRLQKDLENLVLWFDTEQSEREKLPLLDQSASSVLVETETKKGDDKAALKKLTDEIEKLDGQREELVRTETKATLKLESARAKEKEHGEKEQAYQKAYEKITFDSDLRLLIEDTEVDPYSPSLPSLIKRKLKRLENEKLNLTIDQRRRKESLDYLNGDYQLMPPPEDVWCVCEALKARDIPAYPYVKYLSENNIEPERVRKLLKQDPARYGGVCIMRSDDLEQALEVADTLECLRGPVQIYPLDRHMEESGSDSVSHSIVALPKSNATFNRAEASTVLQQMTIEISDQGEVLDTLERRIESITDASNRLNLFIAKYPDGTASNLLAEGEKQDAFIKTLEEKHSVAQNSLVSHDATVSTNIDQKKILDERFKSSEAECFALQYYIDNYEKIIPEKEGRRTDLEKEIKDLQIRLGDITRECEELDLKYEDVKKDKRFLKQQIESKTKLKSGLDYTEGSRGQIPSDINADDLNAVLSFYETFKKDFEDKNEDLEVERAKVQSLKERIEDKKKDLGKYYIETIPDAEFEELQNQYGANEVDRDVITSAHKQFESDKRKAILAEKEVSDAREDLENFIHKVSEFCEPDDYKLLVRTEDYQAKKVALDKKVEQINADITEVSDIIKSLQRDIVSLQSEIEYLGTIIKSVKEKIQGPDDESTETGYQSYKEAQDAWGLAQQSHDSADKAERAELAHVNELKHGVLRILNDEKFSKIATIIRQRINAQMETLHLDAGDFSLEAQNSLQSVTYSLTKTKEQQKEIVGYLFDDVRSVKSNLDALDRISKFPETDTKWAKWSGKKFFQIKIDGKRIDDGYCRTKIEEFVQKVVNGKEKSFPTCAQDIIEGVAKFSLNDITTITTMKPDHFMSTNRETLEEAAKWSGGEGFTYAALSLMVFNQLLCHINASVNIAGGILVVDNPIGICSHLEFIKLQQIMAEILDNQLIYPTAVKDFDALSLFPNVVSLSNNHVDTKTGFNIVQVESHSHHDPEMATTHMTFSEEIMHGDARTV